MGRKVQVFVLLKVFRVFALGFVALVLLGLYGLGAMAVWFQLPQGIGMVAAVFIGLLGAVLVLTALFLRDRRRLLFAAAIVPLVGLGVWWNTIEARNDRDWAPELAENLTAEVSGSKVTLHNIRNFVWRSQTDFDARWESQTYDLDQLESLDVALSYWGIDKIAHVLLSFGFSDGEQIVFSVEIRKERGEAFSELGGLFKQFELSLIAAKEEDILYLRTNARDPLEDVYLFPMNVGAQARRDLFLSYVGLANQLKEAPYWYNTVTANCTTVIYRMVRSFNPAQGFDPSFLLSGELPEFFAQTGMLDWPDPIGDYRGRAAISAKAQAMQPGENYSEVIRRE